MILITTYYDEKHPERRKELIDCLIKNIENPVLTEIHVICENIYPILENTDKINIVIVSIRWDFRKMIEYANSLNADHVKIISNTDIYFNKTLLLANTINQKEVYCLTRWEFITEDKLQFYANFKSQDAWIFKGELPEDIGEYFMGLPGCDNRFAYELKSKGYKLLNPSFSIQAIHLHLTNLRNYNSIKDKVLGNYYYPLPYAFQQIKDNQLKRVFLLIRRKYFTSLMKRNLQGVDVSLIMAILSSFMVLYYKFRLKINE